MRTLLVVAAALALAPPLAADPYRIREEWTGSSIKRDVARSSRLPIDKRYDQLTPDEKAVLHAQYESIGPGDEPPFPADGLRPIMRALAEGQRKLSVRGDLELYVDVDPQGNAQAVSVGRSPDPQLTKFAAQVLMLTKYKPALCKGTPCRMQYPFYVEFKLE